jgi:integrase
MPSVWIEKRRTKASGVRYRVEYRLGGSGSRSRYAGSFRTKAAALARKSWVAGELAALRVPDLSILIAADSPATLFRDAARAWQASRVDVAAGTKVQHGISIGKAIEMIGNVPLDKLTAQTIQNDLVLALWDDGGGNKVGYIRKVLQATAMTLDHANLDPNPARDKHVVRLPRDEATEVRPPSAAHVEAVFWRLPEQHRLPLLWLDWSGARVAAIDHTLVGDYDEMRKRILLRKEVMKNRRSLWLNLPPGLNTAIKALIGGDPERRLFVESRSTSLRTAITKACKAAGVPEFSPHDLRHRRISLLHLGGEPWARIGERVGQRNLATTANTYSHVLLDETEVDYADLLARARGGACAAPLGAPLVGEKVRIRRAL